MDCLASRGDTDQVPPPLPAPVALPARPSKPRVTTTVASPWLRALPHGFAYPVPIDAWWRVSYVLDGEQGRRRYLRDRLPVTITEAAFFARVPRRAGRYYFEPVDVTSRRFADTRLAYFDVIPCEASIAAPVPPRRGTPRRRT